MASVAELEKAIAEQGEKVKTMKAAGEDVSQEVPKLLALKEQLPDDHPLKPKAKKDKKKKAAAPAPAPAQSAAQAAKKAAEKEAKKAERKNKKASAKESAGAQGESAAAPAPKAAAPAKAAPSKSGAPRVFVTGTDHYATAIRIAAAFAGVEVVAQAAPNSHGAPLPASAAVELDGKIFSGNSTALAYCCSASDELRPKNAVEEAQVQQWLSYSNLDLSGAPASAGPAHKELDSALLSRTFLAGEHLSAADIALFTAVHPMMAGSPAKARQSLMNLNRWFEHIQSCVAAHSTLKPVEYLAPEVVGPPGSAPPPQQNKSGAANSSEPKKDKKADKAAAKAAAKAAKADKPKKEKAPQPAVAENISRMDIRVGIVKEAVMHPESEKLFVETIDVGDESGPRQILSGLGGLVSLESMQGRRVVCICNLKTAKLAGMDSHGMVLCASHEPEGGPKVCEPLAPPEGAAVGELITFEGYPSTPDPVLKKSKPWTEVAVDLLTNDEGVACWNKIPFNTTAGPCKISNVSELANKPIK